MADGPRALDPERRFLARGQATSVTVLEFWRWSDSDLLSNTLRGRLAEFIVARAVGATAEVRREWDGYDVETPSGVRIEVKSASYVQSWRQDRPSHISFGIGPRLAWSHETGSYGDTRRRHADVYVFALLGQVEQKDVDSLNLDHWTFYVLLATALDLKVGKQKSIVLPSLLRLAPESATFATLAEVIANVVARSAITAASEASK